MKKSAQQQAIDIAAVQSRMLTIRNQQVLLDRDVAALYGVETKALNQAVKRNAERFEDGYLFQLDAREVENWKSQIVTSNLPEREIASLKMGVRRAPYAFTERGLYILLAAALWDGVDTFVDTVQCGMKRASHLLDMKWTASSMRAKRRYPLHLNQRGNDRVRPSSVGRGSRRSLTHRPLGRLPCVTASVYQAPAVPYHTPMRGSLSTPNIAALSSGEQYNTKQTLPYMFYCICLTEEKVQ